MKPIPLEQFESWLINKQLSKISVENYAYYFLKFASQFVELNQDTAVQFYSKQRFRNSISKAFLVNFRKFLMENYKVLKLTPEELGDLVEMDLSSFKVGVNRNLVYPIPHEEIALLEKNLETERLKIQLLLSYYCALRLGEALKIRHRSFNWKEWGKDMTKMGECRVTGKGGRPGIAIVPGWLMNRISHFFQSDQFMPLTQNSLLFIKANLDDEEINVKNLGRTWQMHLKKAGILSGVTKLDEKGIPTNETRVYPHRLRHSFAHYLLNVKKLNLREVQEMLRHSSITSTQIYTYIDKEELKEKLNK